MKLLIVILTLVNFALLNGDLQPFTETSMGEVAEAPK